MNVIVYAIPVFLALMAAEYGVGLALGRNVYRLNDAIGSLTAGILSQISGVFTLALRVGIYVVVYDHFAFLPLPADDWRVWLFGLLAYDFLYYWNHRVGHGCGLFWAAHVVHHQSENFNLSTALRQTSSGALLRTPAGTIESIVRFGRLGDLAWWGIPRFVRGRYAFEHD